MSGSAGGSRQTNTNQTNLDQTTQQRMQDIWNAAQGAGTAGPSPLVGGATDYYKQMMGNGNLGMGALGGDAGSISTLMNPYQQQVINANNAGWDKTNQQTMNAVDQRATQAGAFGGSRAGVATGTALAANNLAQNQQNAGLLYQGYGDAMGRAGQMAGMGYAGAGQNANLGMGGVGSPQQWMMNMLRGGYMGPTGSSSSGSQAKTQTSFGFKIPWLSNSGGGGGGGDGGGG